MPPKRPKKNFFVLSASVLGFILIALLTFGALFIFSYERTGRHVDVNLEVPATAERGVPFDADVIVVNNAGAELENVVIKLSLSNAVSGIGAAREVGGIIEEPVGNINPSGFAKRTFQLISSAEVDSEVIIQASVSYYYGARTPFETSSDAKFRIIESPIAIEFKAPDAIQGGNASKFEVSYRNTSGSANFNDLSLQIQYPAAMRFISASLPPDSLSNYWRLGALMAGSTGALEIEGLFLGTGEREVNFVVAVYNNILGTDHLLAQKKFSIEFAPLPVTIEILAGGTDTYNAALGEEIEYSIYYRNMSGVALSNVVVSVNFIGEMVPGGTQTVVWNPQTNPELRMVEPGRTGLLRTLLGLRTDFQIRKVGDKNFSVRAIAKLESPTTTQGAGGTIVQTQIETKIKGGFQVEAVAYYRDPVSGFVNRGFLPPRVGEETEYTIHWRIKNQTTDVGGVEVRAELPTGVRFTGTAKSNIETLPIIDEAGAVVWEINEIPATQGFVNEVFWAVFQVSSAPAATEVGGYKLILGETTVQATDNWTGEVLRSRSSALTTALTYDSTVRVGEGIVTP